MLVRSLLRGSRLTPIHKLRRIKKFLLRSELKAEPESECEVESESDCSFTESTRGSWTLATCWRSWDKGFLLIIWEEGLLSIESVEEEDIFGVEGFVCGLGLVYNLVVFCAECGNLPVLIFLRV